MRWPMLLHLRDDVAAALGGGQALRDEAAFERLWALPGKTYRRTATRRTVRVVLGPSAYFAKLHDGVGWREIFKNLLSFKQPVLGAANEYAACRHLAAHGVPAPAAVAFGRQGWNPATQRSLVLCEALADHASLEAVVRGCRAPSLALRRRLLREAARLTRRLHGAGVNHRDYYLCHLFADLAKLARGEVALAVIDLHRAAIRRRVPRRWRRRDLAALLYSAASAAAEDGSGWALSRADRFRFVRDYAARRPAAVVRGERRFWNAVAARAARLQRRGHRDTAALPDDDSP